MMVLHMDLSSINDQIQQIPGRAQVALQKWGAALAAMTHAHIAERASQELRSTKDPYLEALSFFQAGPETWVVSLERKALWIEDGLSQHEMINDLLKSTKTKTAKDGSRYLAVPFRHNKAPTRTPVSVMELQNTIRAELKKREIPYGKIEKDAAGKARLGLLHRLDIVNAPIKTANLPGQGKGPIGSVMQGPTGIPLLQGIRIYQRQVTDKRGRQHVERNIMTFRTVSSKHTGTGRWVHPGLPPRHFFDEAYVWAMREWETSVKPKVIAEIVGG